MVQQYFGNKIKLIDGLNYLLLLAIILVNDLTIMLCLLALGVFIQALGFYFSIEYRTRFKKQKQQRLIVLLGGVVLASFFYFTRHH